MYLAQICPDTTGASQCVVLSLSVSSVCRAGIEPSLSRKRNDGDALRFDNFPFFKFLIETK